MPVGSAAGGKKAIKNVASRREATLDASGT